MYVAHPTAGRSTAKACSDVCITDNPDIDELMKQAEMISHGDMDDDLADLFSLYQVEEDISATTSTEDQLEEQLPESAGTLPQPARPVVQMAMRPECHAIFGDSIARDLVLPVLPNDSTINLSQPGNTYDKEEVMVHDYVSEWIREAAKRGASPGKALIWMGGNETYGRPRSTPRGLNPDAVADVIGTVKNVASTVVVAGPVVRLWRDRGAR